MEPEHAFLPTTAPLSPALSPWLACGDVTAESGTGLPAVQALGAMLSELEVKIKWSEKAESSRSWFRRRSIVVSIQTNRFTTLVIEWDCEPSEVRISVDRRL